MQKLLVFQSLWGMERLRSEDRELTLAEKIERIAAAGFDGVTDHFYDRRHVAPLMALVRDHGLTIEGQVFPRNIDELAPALEMAADFGCHHITIQPDICPMTVAECVPILEGWQRLAEQAGVAVYVETHRGRMTNDLLFTMQLLDAVPALRFTVDLSHYVVAREINLHVQNDTDAMIGRILDHGWAMHGRVAGSHQVQLELSFPQHQLWFSQFRHGGPPVSAAGAGAPQRMRPYPSPANWGLRPTPSPAPMAATRPIAGRKPAFYEKKSWNCGKTEFIR